MTKVWTRREAEENPSKFYDAAKQHSQVMEDSDGRFVLSFERRAKQSLEDWAMLPGTLEDGDEL